MQSSNDAVVAARLEPLAGNMVYRFGATRGLYLDLARLGLIVGLVLAVLFGAQLAVFGSGIHGWRIALLIGCALLAAPIVVCLLAGVCIAAFSVHVSTVTVRHMLFDRLELSEYPVTAFVEVLEDRGVLVFANRRRLRIAGMHEAELRRLAGCIRAMQSPSNQWLGAVS